MAHVLHAVVVHGVYFSGGQLAVDKEQFIDYLHEVHDEEEAATYSDLAPVAEAVFVEGLMDCQREQCGRKIVKVKRLQELEQARKRNDLVPFEWVVGSRVSRPHVRGVITEICDDLVTVLPDGETHETRINRGELVGVPWEAPYDWAWSVGYRVKETPTYAEDKGVLRMGTITQVVAGTLVFRGDVVPALLSALNNGESQTTSGSAANRRESERRHEGVQNWC